MKDRLKELSKEISEILRGEYDPHTTVVINDSHVRIVQDAEGFPTTDGSDTDT